MHSLLLDTHIFVWLIAKNGQLTQKDKDRIEACTQSEGKILVSAISIWEIGMLSQKGRLTMQEPVLQWVKEAIEAPYIQLVPLSPEIAIESCQLPGEFHGDPADRILVATSRVLNVPLLTRDNHIRTYAQGGYLKCA